MKSVLKKIDDHGEHYEALLFACPGCKEFGGSGLHMLCVNSSIHNPSWLWNGSLEMPTLSPSILSRIGKDREHVCHSFLRDGVFEFLQDCTHSLAGQKVPMPDLPGWATREV